MYILAIVITGLVTMAIAVVTISRARTLNRSKGLFRAVLERQGTYPLPTVDTRSSRAFAELPFKKPTEQHR